MLLAPALGEPPRAIAERLGERARRAARRRPSSGWRSPGPASSTCSWPTRWYLDALADAARGGRATTAPGAERRARERRVREREPDRADDRSPRRATPRTATRSGAHPRARRATRSSASTTSTTPAARCSASASRSGRARAARSRRRTATRATTCASWPTAIEGAAEGDPTSWPRRGDRADARGRARHARALPRAHGPASSPSARCTRRGAIEAALERLDGTSTSTTARSGCARPRSATTRTACCAARTASWTYFAADIAYHAGQARARLRPRDRRLGRRPPRLHRADEGRLAGARRRPRAPSRS